jgi:tRNA A-37 threonylcarbamoyl transferase component Bud32
MPVVICSSCARKLNVPTALDGKKVRCPGCAAVSLIHLPPPTHSVGGPEQATLDLPGAASAPPVPPVPADDPEATLSAPEASAPVPVDNRAPPGYEILQELGRGGKGVVYKARQVRLNRTVALKMILAGVHAGPDELARFHTEAEAIARLQDPGIVQIYEVGEHDGLPFFSMEFCPGGSLETKLAGTPLRPRKAAALVQDLAEAIQSAHEANVVHRDLKPGNILLSANGTPKITDFGLAKKLDEQGQTQTGSVMGTPSYMAPEQAAGSKDIGPAADVHALGAILYECLTGRPPFRAATSYDTILEVMSEAPVPPRQRNAKVPIDLETICLKCLRKEPAERYRSAEALAEDLGHFLAREPIEARPVGALERASKFVRRNRVVAGLVTAVILILTSGVIATTLLTLDARRKADALEKTLIDSLLLPIGRTNGQLDPIEREALVKLASLPSERSRMRLLEVALREPGTARQVGRRADWVIQATVGVNERRREEVERLLVRRLQEGVVPDDVALACVWLGVAIDARDPLWTERAVKVLVPTTSETALRIELLNEWAPGPVPMAPARGGVMEAEGRLSASRGFLTLQEVIEAVCRRLETAEAERTAVALVAALREAPNDPSVLSLRALSFQALAARVDAAGANRVANDLVATLQGITTSADQSFVMGFQAVSERLDADGESRAVEALVAALRSTRNGSVLSLLAACLKPLGARLDATAAGQAADALIAALKSPDNRSVTAGLAQGLGTVGTQLDRARAARAARALVAAMGHPDNSRILSTLAASLEVVSGQLDPTEAATAAAGTAEALVAAMKSGTAGAPPSPLLLPSLQKVSARLDAAGAAKVADVLVSALGDPRNASALASLGQAVTAVAPKLDSPGAARVASALIRIMKDPQTPFNHASLTNAFRAVSARLDGTAASKVADALVADLSDPTQARFRFPLGQAMGAVGARLDATTASRVADALVAAMKDPKNAFALSSLTPALETVGARLDGAAAARLVDAFGEALSNPSNLIVLSSLGRAIAAVGPRLDRTAATRMADALIAAMKDPTKTFALSSLAQALAGVSLQMDDAGLSKATDALVAALGEPRNANAFTWLGWALERVGARLDAAAASRAADALVAALSTARAPAATASTTTTSSPHFWLLRALKVMSGRMDPGQAARVADTLVALMRNPANHAALPWLVQALEALCKRLDGAAMTRTAAALVDAIGDPKTPYFIDHLAQSLAHVCSRLGGAGTVHAGKGAAALVAALSRPHELAFSPSLPKALGTLLPLLDEETAKPLAARAARVLVADLRNVEKGGSLSTLARAIAVVGSRLDPGDASNAASTLVATLSVSKNALQARELVQALEAVGPRLSADEANKAAAALIEASSKTTNAGNLTSQVRGIQAVIAPQGAEGIVRLLQHPLAAGPTQRALLDVLGRPTRRTFHSTWDFIDWAKSNGVDFLAAER